MTPDADDADDAAKLSPAVRARLELVRRTLGSMSLQQRSRGNARALARFSRPKRSAAPWAMAAVVAVASLVFVLRGWLPRPAPPVSFVVEGALVAADGAVHGGAAGDRRPIMRFSDGTEVEVGAGARAHVASLTQHGARISLDEGEVRARVVHWERARWLFDAGPCTVTVTGTAFTLAWSPDEERIDLRLENGSVEVGGPILDQPIPLRSGKWLTLRLREHEILIRDIPGGEQAVGATGSSADTPEAPTPTVAETTVADAGPAAAPPAPPSRQDWASNVASGKFQQVIQEAERLGIDACLAQATSSELAALADAARYTKRRELSKKALLAQRQRFPGSRRAAEAAFLLGRLGESNGATAVSWYDDYLAEAPAGPYAPEALGRKMILVEKMSGRAAAAKVAREYLLRFPRGTYARAADALLQAP
jgi:hypothetical protein